MVMPRAVFIALGGFDPKLRVMEDFELQQRALGAGLQLYFVQHFAVTHWARGTWLKSWRHSWYWGRPYRSAYLERVRDPQLKFPLRSRWFFFNLPFIFQRRMRLVLRSAWATSRRDTLTAFPFLTSTIFAWSLAAVRGGGQPPPDKVHAE